MAARPLKLPRLCLLQRSTPAIEASGTAGGLLAGRSALLPQSAELLVCGAGFDEHTVKVLWKDAYYFVYARHLKQGMSHLSAEEWLEFAKGTISPEQRQRMQGHLDGGCTDCQRLSASWRETLAAAQRESSFEPPAESVLSVKEVFQTRTRWAWLPKIAEFARLVFDSALQPVTVRSNNRMASSRHLLHETEMFAIDLRIEQQPARQRASLTGQVLYSNEPTKHIPATKVTLLQYHDIAAETAANASGEFNLKFAGLDGLELFVEVQGHRAVGISLPV